MSAGRSRCREAAQLSSAALSSAALGAALALVSGAVRAEPQWNTGVVPALCTIGSHGDLWGQLAFCGELRSDLLFGRSRTSDFGLGPYVSLGTAAFDDLRAAGGMSALIPVVEDFPIVASAGALVTSTGQVGFDTSLFYGVRSYNFHSSYNIGLGVLIGAEHTFGSGGDTIWSLGVQIDGLVVALPFIFGWGALQ